MPKMLKRALEKVLTTDEVNQQTRVPNIGINTPAKKADEHTCALDDWIYLLDKDKDYT
ncbi:MAG: hypothetical protein H3Z50_03895 [archaeon]|nr:hypothetical protein [archaeon]MCP8306594.1 hypothetical protein [archaeon]